MAIPPTSRPPIALGCPVNEKGPEPGFPTCPVNNERFSKAVFLSTPIALWFNPIAQSERNPLALPIISAANLMSFTEIPQSLEAFSKELDSTKSLYALKLSVWFLMKSLSVYPFSISLLAKAWYKTISVPGMICKCKSAVKAESVFLGSMTMTFTLGFLSRCCSSLLKRIGWHQAGFAPVIKNVSANSISS
ncbi:hypothetical protein D3C80_877170 [compost metagenome]